MDICKTEVLTCKTERERVRLVDLAKMAEAQMMKNETEFTKMFPWRFVKCEFDEDAIHIVASTETLVCGWAVLREIHREGYNIIDLESITTRRKRMGDQRIGKILFEAIQKYVESNNFDFIVLHGISDSVLNLYAKWGFGPLFSSDEISTIGNSPALLKEYLRHLMVYPAITEPSQSYKNSVIEEGKAIINNGFLLVNYKNTNGGKRKTRRAHKK